MKGVSCASSWTNSSKEDIINFKALPSADQISHHRKDLFSFQPNDSDCHLKGCEPSTKKRKLACSDWTEPDLEPGFKNSDSRSRNGLHDANHRFENESMKFTRHQSTQQHFNSIFMVLEENIVAFVKNELNHISKAVASGCPEDGQSNVKDVSKGEDEEQKRSSREAVLKLAMNFLRMMKQEKLADLLQCGTSAAVGQRKLKSKLKKSFQCVFEGIAREGNPICLNQIYTELFVTAGGRTSVSDQHEFMQIETASRNPDKGETKITHEQIFESSPEKLRPIRAVMTKGVAGIGKTVLTQKFALDWAEDKTNQDVHFVFPFMFRELNVLKEKKFSLMELVHHFFTETKEICEFEKFPVVFIFDGLDECRLPLDFHNNEILTDVAQSASVDVLLTNLMRGYLLPSARLWITTRPAAANQIPPECVDMVTEVRGFADLQKEHYFMKRIRDEEQARRIISHIKTTKSLHLMCHIPVFCWITATVLEEVFKTRDGKKLPKTLTEMYIHFLVVQTKVKSLKYDGEAELDHWSPENRKMIKSLGKLAFEQLQKGNLIFNESDLENCGIDIRAVSVSSGVFTQIFKEEKGGLYQDKVFTFVHLSVQEFLAALYVHLMFFNSDVNLLEDENSSEFEDFYQSAVNIALKSPNGHLDLFLRFLLGLSLQSNQTLLQGLLRKTSVSPQTDISPITIKNTSNYIKKKLNEGISVDKSISLLYCLNELNDLSLVEKIQESLALEQLSTDELSPADWSALAFLLLSSEKDLDVFELKKYSASEEAFLRLLPVVKAANKALLSGCNLSGGSFESLSLVLSSHPSVLRELDLSNNDLKDSGVKQLSAGLRSPNCKLEILGLSVCNLNKRSCEMLSSVLSSKSSVLREMDLSNNDLQDAGVKLLSSGLESPHCKLQKLRLSGCLVTEEGCRSLFSALSSNPSHLTELDLSYNHPGEAAGKLFSAKLQDQNWKLDVLRMEPFGERWLRPGLRKYYFKTTFDPNTINRQIKLSDDDSRAVHVREDQSYPDHPERFQDCPQLLCSEDLTGRHYWEVDWSGWVDVSVSYRGISRRVERADCRFGGNEQSWSLSCSDGGGYYVYHQKKRSFISHSSAAPKKVAVYVDYPAGSVSFFRGCGDALIHLYTFSTTFTEPLCPGVGFRFRFRSKTDSFALLYSV
ncbi:NACHT, LRR and PYD domains-containing protein 3-like isoform X2 [Poecilia reticulata]|uniref:NACHT, LRR and PYD domains-containing protein 3-like isoform X2 n=1 Tax=Poecilia reticulata TaxID=8081 RepID=UPI0004A378C9|nr:PREDICTED: NACHT, LRR and PYD domains-containing protein 3-like isoform X2 [Poecilia reticulata]